MTNVLVTGAAGFLGSFLSEELVERGYFVLGIDNFFRGKRENLRKLFKSKRFKFECIDLSQNDSIDKVAELVKKNHVEQVFHFAAINGTQHFYDHSFSVLDKNICITQNVLHALNQSIVKFIVYASSSEVYGDAMEIPTAEDHPILLKVNADRDSYAISKAVGEFYVRLYAKKNNLDCLILRIFNVYGPRMVNTKYGQVIPEFIHRTLSKKTFTILGDGTQTRSFCYVLDMTKIICDLFEKSIVGIINVGCDEIISITELAKMIHAINNTPFKPIYLPERPFDHWRRQPNIDRLKKALPGILFLPLEKGLLRVFDAQRKDIL